MNDRVRFEIYFRGTDVSKNHSMIFLDFFLFMEKDDMNRAYIYQALECQHIHAKPQLPVAFIFFNPIVYLTDVQKSRQ